MELFENIERLWKEARGGERRRLISPLIERAYVDLEQKLVGGNNADASLQGPVRVCGTKKRCRHHGGIATGTRSAQGLELVETGGN